MKRNERTATEVENTTRLAIYKQNWMFIFNYFFFFICDGVQKDRTKNLSKFCFAFMDSDPHIFLLALARKIGIKIQEETGKSVLDCVNSYGERANFNMSKVRAQTVPYSRTNKFLWLENPVVSNDEKYMWMSIQLTKKNGFLHSFKKWRIAALF